MADYFAPYSAVITCRDTDGFTDIAPAHQMDSTSPNTRLVLPTGVATVQIRSTSDQRLTVKHYIGDEEDTYYLDAGEGSLVLGTVDARSELGFLAQG